MSPGACRFLPDLWIFLSRDWGEGGGGGSLWLCVLAANSWRPIAQVERQGRSHDLPGSLC